MAIQYVPTLAVRVDNNPKGSATKHVTMRADNPFERQAPVMRSANQPRDMLPGMGAFDYMAPIPDTQGVATPSIQAGGQTASGTSSTSSGWGDFFGGLTKSLTSAAVDVGSAYATSQLVDKRVDTGPSTQDLMTMAVMQQMTAAQGASLPAPQPVFLQAPQAQPLPIIAPPAPQPAPQKSNALLWAGLGIGALVLIGGGFLVAKKRK